MLIHKGAPGEGQLKDLVVVEGGMVEAQQPPGQVVRQGHVEGGPDGGRINGSERQGGIGARLGHEVQRLAELIGPLKAGHGAGRHTRGG